MYTPYNLYEYVFLIKKLVHITRIPEIFIRIIFSYLKDDIIKNENLKCIEFHVNKQINKKIHNPERHKEYSYSYKGFPEKLISFHFRDLPFENKIKKDAIKEYIYKLLIDKSLFNIVFSHYCCNHDGIVFTNRISFLSCIVTAVEGT